MTKSIEHNTQKRFDLGIFSSSNRSVEKGCIKKFKISAIYGTRESLKVPQNRFDLGEFFIELESIRRERLGKFGNRPLPSNWVSTWAITHLFGRGPKKSPARATSSLPHIRISRRRKSVYVVRFGKKFCRRLINDSISFIRQGGSAQLKIGTYLP